MKYFVMFYHAPKSGSTLLTAILNANPNCMISNQQFILNDIENHTQESLFNIIENGTSRYNFKDTVKIPHVPKQEITVIGDKTGHRSLLLLNEHPRKLGELREVVKVPIKSILIVRNPFDVLATWSKNEYEVKQKKGIETTYRKELDTVIKEYIILNDTIEKLKKSENMLTVRHEYVITRMHNTLEEVANFLEISFDPIWRDNVRNSVWRKPRITRKRVPWTPNQRGIIYNLISKYDWLKGYDFGPTCGGCNK